MRTLAENWIRIPAIIYASHTVTALVPILASLISDAPADKRAVHVPSTAVFCSTYLCTLCTISCRFAHPASLCKPFSARLLLSVVQPFSFPEP